MHNFDNFASDYSQFGYSQIFAKSQSSHIYIREKITNFKMRIAKDQPDLPQISKICYTSVITFNVSVFFILRAKQKLYDTQIKLQCYDFVNVHCTFITVRFYCTVILAYMLVRVISLLEQIPMSYIAHTCRTIVV